MFDLESAIASWKTRTSLHESITPSAVDELETHLRDQVADLRTAGLDAEEAFTIALKRLGHPAELATEYAAATPGNEWRRRIFWGVLGYLEISLLLAIASTLGKAATWIAAASGASASLPAIALGTHIAFFAAIASAVGGIWVYVSKNGFPGLGEIYTRHPARIATLTVVALVLTHVGGRLALAGILATATGVETAGAVSLWLSYYSVGAHALALTGLAVAVATAGRVFRQPALG